MPDTTERGRAREVTISLPAFLLEMIDQLAKEQATSRSFIIAQEIQKLTQEGFETKMRDGYIAHYGVAQQMAEEDLVAGNEVWAEWK